MGVGSIAAGGRYDDLVGMFSGSTGMTGKIPCVGISFGVERIFSLLLAEAKAAGSSNARSKATQVYVVSIGDGLLRERISVCNELWAAGINVSKTRLSFHSCLVISTDELRSVSYQAEFMFKKKPKLAKQFEQIDKDQTPFAVLVAPEELAEGNIRVKQQVGKEEADGKGELMARSELVAYLKTKLNLM